MGCAPRIVRDPSPHGPAQLSLSSSREHRFPPDGVSLSLRNQVVSFLI
jgi:hypothetical protein